jgi:hypothetical protein
LDEGENVFNGKSILTGALVRVLIGMLLMKILN